MTSSSGRSPSPPPEPVLSFREEPAGRDTLQAISQEKPSVLLEPRTTQHYGDRISNAPGAASPRLARALDTRPEIQVKVEMAGRQTQALLQRELRAEEPEIEVTEPRTLSQDLLALEVEQLCEFLLRAPLSNLQSPSVQAELIRLRLLPRLPIQHPRDVLRVELSPGPSPDTTWLRLWCRVS